MLSTHQIDILFHREGAGRQLNVGQLADVVSPAADLALQLLLAPQSVLRSAAACLLKEAFLKTPGPKRSAIIVLSSIYLAVLDRGYIINV